VDDNIINSASSSSISSSNSSSSLLPLRSVVNSLIKWQNMCKSFHHLNKSHSVGVQCINRIIFHRKEPIILLKYIVSQKGRHLTLYNCFLLQKFPSSVPVKELKSVVIWQKLWPRVGLWCLPFWLTVYTIYLMIKQQMFPKSDTCDVWRAIDAIWLSIKLSATMSCEKMC